MYKSVHAQPRLWLLELEISRCWDVATAYHMCLVTSLVNCCTNDTPCQRKAGENKKNLNKLKWQ